MKFKVLFVTIYTLAFYSKIYSQNIIPNGGFENWKNDTSLNDWRYLYPFNIIYSPLRITQDSTPRPFEGKYTIELMAQGGLSDWVSQKVGVHLIPDSFSISYYYRGQKPFIGKDKFRLGLLSTRINGSNIDTLLNQKIKWDLDTGQKQWQTFTTKIDHHPNIQPDSIEISIEFLGGGDCCTTVFLLLDDVYLNGRPINTMVNQIASHTLINIYPNPANQVLYISSMNQNSDVKIYNILGELITGYNINKKDSTLEFDIANWPAGVYFVRAEGLCQKWIKY